MTDELVILGAILLMPVILVVFVIVTGNWRRVHSTKFVMGLWICLGAILIGFAFLATVVMPKWSGS